MELLIAGTALLALAPLAVRVRAEQRARGWVRAGVAVGLGGGDAHALRGVIDSFDVTLHLRPSWRGPRAAVVLESPTPEPNIAGAAALRRRLVGALAIDQYASLAQGMPAVEHALRNPDALRAALRALDLVERGVEPRLMVELFALPGDELGHLGDVLCLLTWMARQLGWQRRTASEGLAAVGLCDPDPLVRLRTLERLLGGWHPSSIDTDIARRAVADPDPWVRVLGALHLGLEGLPLLHDVVRDPHAPDALVARALAGVWDDLPAPTLVRLLGREDPTLVTRAARGLARVGTPAALWALRRHRGGPAGRAVEDAIRSIEARRAEQAGRLSEADPAVGRLST